MVRWWRISLCQMRRLVRSSSAVGMSTLIRYCFWRVHASWWIIVINRDRVVPPSNWLSLQPFLPRHLSLSLSLSLSVSVWLRSKRVCRLPVCLFMSVHLKESLSLPVKHNANIIFITFLFFSRKSCWAFFIPSPFGFLSFFLFFFGCYKIMICVQFKGITSFPHSFLVGYQTLQYHHTLLYNTCLISFVSDHRCPTHVWCETKQTTVGCAPATPAFWTTTAESGLSGGCHGELSVMGGSFGRLLSRKR